MSGCDKYWKCEYELLRRKKNNEIENMILRQIKMIDKTLKLLKSLGMSERDILAYYKEDQC